MGSRPEDRKGNRWIDLVNACLKEKEKTKLGCEQGILRAGTNGRGL